MGARATATSHSELGEKLIAGVPARIMRPRLVFICCLLAICSFGLLMVYSASAVEALKEQGSSWYYLFRQGIFMAIGFAFLLVLNVGHRAISMQSIRMFWGPASWFVVLGLLVVVLFMGAGGDTWGASRWLPLGFFNLQPAEFAKPAIILVAARLLAEYYEDRSISFAELAVAMFIVLVVPAFLIMRQPDMGTTVIIGGAVFIMVCLCGLPMRIIGGLMGAAVVLLIFGIFSSEYRIERFKTFLDPWSDPYDTGYQATLSIMAFASGGLFGRGIGNATMKYHYLPEAHNDYILAIIGEELGFFGTLIFVCVFIAMIIAALRIASQSPSLYSRLVASGCAIALALQFLINVCGILNIIPMTGKPLPFVSYGGSSVLTSLILAALIIRVSIDSNVETAADRRRAGMAVMGAAGPMDGSEDVSSHMGRSTAGQACTRSSRATSGLSVYDGGRASASPRRGAGRSDAPGTPPRRGVSRDAGRGRETGGYERVDLGSRASDRLRPRDAGPHVRGTSPRSSSRYPRDERYDRGSGQSRRGRYDR